MEKLSYYVWWYFHGSVILCDYSFRLVNWNKQYKNHNLYTKPSSAFY